ncbi:hypothetical protein [Streptomyces sp. NPDC088731]|uniref:hypothetical protein n=1 Tax=Streptomyces sp. NPDC088731 TaxID=3365878 RepID=UPI0038295980
MTADAPLMAPDQMIRALDYVEAVHDSDCDAMDRLEAAGHPPMRYLLADLLELLVRSVGAAEELGGEVPQARRDHAAALGLALVTGVSEWARSAQPDLPESSSGEVEIPDYQYASEGIARTVAAYVLSAFDGVGDDLKGRLGPVRAAWSAARPG